MRQNLGSRKSHGEVVVKDIRCATRKRYSTEEKFRMVPNGLKGEGRIAELCRRKGIAHEMLKGKQTVVKLASRLGAIEREVWANSLHRRKSAAAGATNLCVSNSRVSKRRLRPAERLFLGHVSDVCLSGLAGF